MAEFNTRAPERPAERAAGLRSSGALSGPAAERLAAEAIGAAEDEAARYLRAAFLHGHGSGRMDDGTPSPFPGAATPAQQFWEWGRRLGEAERAESLRTMAAGGVALAPEDQRAVLLAAGELARVRVRKKPFNSAHEAASVIREEYEEFWDEVKKRRELRDHAEMLKELYQTAAACCRAIADLRLEEKAARAAGGVGDGPAATA